MKNILSDAYGRLPIRIQYALDQIRGGNVRAFKQSIYDGLVPAGRALAVCTCGQHSDATLKIKSNTRKVVFVWDPLRGMSGSTLMRVHQSSERINSLFPEIKVSVCPIQSPDVFKIKDAIIFLSKSVLLDDSAYRMLCGSSNIMLVDYVDGSHIASIDTNIDGFICASFVEHSWTKKHYSKPSFLVPHAIDARLNSIALSEHKDSKFNCGYFGHLDNGLMVQTLTELGKIQLLRDSIVANESEAQPDWMFDALRMTAHYIARPIDQQSSGQFKPFTKGFLAAHCGAITVGGKYEVENVHWLGADYPFLVEDQTIESAVRALDRCQDSWMSRDFDHARQVALENRQVSCPISNAKDYVAAITHFS